MLINENTIEQACLRFLQELGWDYTHGSTINADGENPWRLRTDEVVFRSVLREAVERLNPQLPSATVDEVVALVCKTDITDLTERNQQAYRYLREGVRVEYPQLFETLTWSPKTVNATWVSATNWNYLFN